MINVGWYFYRNYYNDIDTSNEKIVGASWDLTQTVPCLGNKDISLKTTYPGLFSGSGIAHGTGETGEFKLGFAFDHTTGQPYLSGSSVKGTIRSAFPFRLAALASKQKKKEEKDNKDPKEANRMFGKAKVLLEEYFLKTDKKVLLSAKQLFQLEWEIFEGLKITNLDKIWDEDLSKINFSKIEAEPIGSYERDIFYDAFISEPNSKKKFLGKDFITPHKHKTNRKLDALVNPIPIQFLKVLPNVTFQFQFDLKDGLISAEDKRKLFRQILLDFGIGAKTNVGYGQFE